MADTAKLDAEPKEVGPLVEETMSLSPTKGVIDIGNGLTPLDIWTGLHQNAVAWLTLSNDATGREQRASIDGSDRQVLRELPQKLPITNWYHLCESVGWTAYGAAVFSWCKGADFNESLEAFRKWPHLNLEDDLCIRAARFYNPQLLPSLQLSQLIQATKDPIGLWVLLHCCIANDQSVIVDIPENRMATMKPLFRDLVNQTQKF